MAMNPGFRFHPKAILLSGEETAHLFIGSGNMTFGGIRENAEIWSRFDVNENESNGEVSAFREYFQSILQICLHLCWTSRGVDPESIKPFFNPF